MNFNWRQTPAVAQTVDYRKNSLNTLKLIAALQVLYGHAWVHMSYSFPTIVSNILGIFMGVPIFFMLSGFLVWTSVGSSSDYKNYASKRFWRIYPELWLGVLFELVVLLILFKDKVNYLLLSVFAVTQGTVLQFWTPEFLRGYGCGTPNGALWTICVTVQFYVIVWLLYKLLHKKKAIWWVLFFIVAVFIKALSPAVEYYYPGIIYKLFKVSILPYLWLFILGCALSEFREKSIPFLKKYWFILLVLSFVVDIIKFDIDSANYGILLYSLRVPGFIGMAYALPRINVKRDISYGIYIYHMTVINAMIELNLTGRLVYVILALVLSVLLAYGSTSFANFINEKINLRKVQ